MRVRLIHNPSRIGVLTGRRIVRGGRDYSQVQFPDNIEYKANDQLEEVPEFETPVDLLESEKYSAPTDLRKVLIHSKVSGKMVDVVYSMNATNTEFFAYQFKPVLKILDSPSNSLLIADEVGLGKTIEAGLIWTELKMRYNFNRLMILCPAALREKWQIELSKRFGVSARICTAKETLDELRKKAQYKKDTVLIGSLQGHRPSKLKQDEKTKTAQTILYEFLESKEHEEPIIDLLIIDEAHHMRNYRTKSRRLGQLFCDVSNFKIFLTATPLHNQNSDLFSLLQLLDPSTFSDKYSFENILSANKPLIKARNLSMNNILHVNELLNIVKEAKRHTLLVGNKQLEHIEDYIKNNTNITSANSRSHLAQKLESVNLLSNVLTRTRKREVHEWRVIRSPRAEFVQMTQSEREFYNFVTSIVIRYAQSCEVNERFLLAQPQRQITSSIPACLQSWITRFEKNQYVEDEQELGPLVSEIISEILNSSTFNIEQLEKNDSKYRVLHSVLNRILKENTEEKIVLFSTFRSTLFYLSRKLNDDKISNIVMVGGQPLSKDEVIRKFASKDGPSVLLSSEVGSEGVDMQFSRFVINYDLPWNPMKVEQRIGRIDRLGQSADQIFIWNLFYNNTIDARIYERLYNRLNLIVESLGDFEAVLGEKIQKLEIDLVSTNLTKEQQEDRIEQTAIALENLKRTEEELENQSADLVAYGDYILSQIHTARDLQRWINSEDLRQYLLDHLRLNYQGVRIQHSRSNNSYTISLPPEAKARLAKYGRDTNQSGMSFYNNYHDDIICKFDNKVAITNQSNIEIVNQYHPLVKWVSYEISQNDTPLRPTVAIKVDFQRCEEYLERGVYLICINLWMFEGIRKIDRLEYRGVNIQSMDKLDPTDAEKLSVIAAIHGEYWRDKDVDSKYLVNIANNVILNELQDSYEEFVAEQSAKNEDRLQIQSLNNQMNFERRMESLLDTKRNLELKGKNSMVKLTDGRIAALKQRTETVHKQIELYKATKSESTELAIALINVI